MTEASTGSTDSAANANRVRLLTPPGRSAVATIEVVGPDAIQLASRCFQRANKQSVENLPPWSIAFGHWYKSENPDEQEGVVLARTAANRVEVHCHGGSVAARRIVADLTEAGCLVAAEDHQAERPKSEQEAETALANALTENTALILVDQFNGAITRSAAAIATLINNDEIAQAESLLESLLSTYRMGRHLSQPWQVVIAGPANVGKSSLINAIVGYERAIVFSQPGTTRDVVTALTAIDGWPVELADTAGLRVAGSDIESLGIERARNRFAAADVAILVVDAQQSLDDLSRDNDWKAMRSQRPDAIYVRNKSDLVKRDRTIPPQELDESILTSAVEMSGIDELLEAIRRAIRGMETATPIEIDRAMLFTERQRNEVATALLQIRSATPLDATQTLLAL